MDLLLCPGCLQTPHRRSDVTLGAGGGGKTEWTIPSRAVPNFSNQSARQTISRFNWSSVRSLAACAQSMMRVTVLDGMNIIPPWFWKLDGPKTSTALSSLQVQSAVRRAVQRSVIACLSI